MEGYSQYEKGNHQDKPHPGKLVSHALQSAPLSTKAKQVLQQQLPMQLCVQMQFYEEEEEEEGCYTGRSRSYAATEPSHGRRRRRVLHGSLTQLRCN
jgi:hypothetical protein